MAFEQVSVSSLNSAINACENSINYNNTLNNISNISDNNVWNASSRDNLKNALNILVNERYKELEEKLNVCKQVAALIGEYKQIEQKILELENEIDRLQDDLYKEKEYTVTKKDANGNEIKETKTKKVKDHAVESRINSLEQEIANYKQKLIEIESKVASLV